MLVSRLSIILSEALLIIIEARRSVHFSLSNPKSMELHIVILILEDKIMPPNN